MSLAVFSYIVGIVEILLGVPLIIAPDRTMKWMEKMIADDVIIRLVGGFFVVVCALLLMEDMQIGTDVAGLMRLVVWIVLAKCLILAWWPQYMRNILNRFSVMPAFCYFMGFLATIVGVIFILAGNILS